MRVIAGEAKGAKLKGPPSFATRPMADKIKGALFSMLGSLGVEPNRVLDLYAGTGSIGIEALSRGATWADFVDQNAAVCAVIRDNLAHTKLIDEAEVYQLPVAAFLGRSEPAYDLIILDPPYADPEILKTLARVAAASFVAPGTVVVVGHSKRVKMPERSGRLSRLRERCHGDSCFSVFEADIDEADADEAATVPDIEAGT